jgi:hypothetical protein
MAECSRLDTAMSLRIAIAACVLTVTAATAEAALFGREAARPDEFRQLSEARPLPVALDPAFEFRKTKTLVLGDAPSSARNTSRVGAAREPSITFEGAYRLYGAVTALDQRRRYGHYFDFFWRAKRPAAVTVRLEYRQERLRAFTQAREVDYARTRGNHRTSFAVIGDDFLTDGRILAWRCLLIENGRIVARSARFLWRRARQQAVLRGVTRSAARGRRDRSLSSHFDTPRPNLIVIFEESLQSSIHSWRQRPGRVGEVEGREISQQREPLKSSPASGRAWTTVRCRRSGELAS